MKITDKQQAAIERAAKVLETQGYDAFLRFLAFNKQQHEQTLQQAAIKRSFQQ